MVYTECTRCVMDKSDKDITFDQRGVCNWCTEASERLPSFMPDEPTATRQLNEIIHTIKSQGRGKYDSIIGLSGGVDSSYLAYWAKSSGLNPLAVHFDNGWNSKIAVSNIQKIIDKCDIDLQTYVINWEEFKDLQKSFLKAGVIDIEMITDHAINATLRKYMKKHGIKYALSGTNYTTEHGLPSSWGWQKADWINIKSIHKEYGTVPLKTFPHIGFFHDLMLRSVTFRKSIVQPLDRMNYSKTKAMNFLKEKFDWQYYGGKHYESTFTKFYQAYILPEKFGIDKRRSHLSCQIRTGEITKEEAIKTLSEPLYDTATLSKDKQYICKKLELSEAEFDNLMKQDPREHTDFASGKIIRNKILAIASKIPFK